VLTVAQQIGPLRARPTLTPFVALWTRLQAFAKQELADLLYRERALSRIPCMHSHLHVVPSPRLPAYFQTVRSYLDPKTESFFDYLLSIAKDGQSHREFSLSTLVPRVLEVVNTRGPCTIEQLTRWLPLLGEQVFYHLDQDVGHFALGTRLIPAMCAQGLLIHAEPRGSWRSDVDTYASLSSWLPTLDMDESTPREALGQVLLDYIGAFGPVTVGDMIHWLGGVQRRHIVGALMRVQDRLVRVEIKEPRRDAYMRLEDIDALYAQPPEPRFVRFVPPRDGCLMAYRDPGRFVPQHLVGRVYDWAGESRGAVLVDGTVQGLWTLHSRPDTLVVRLFESLDPEAVALIGEEARSLGRFIEDRSIDIDIATEEDEGTPEPASPAVQIPQT